MKAAIIILILINSLTTQARDATDIQRVIINPAVVTTKADIALAIANATSNTMTGVKATAEKAEEMAKGTMAAATDQSSCFYDNDFDCTEQNLTHVYQIKSWTTPGNYTWTVPTGINQVYAIVVSGQGGQGGAGGPGFVCSNGVNGSNGSNSSFDSLIAVGGSGGSGGQATSYGCDITVNGSYGQSNQTNGHIDVITGTSINVIVGIGGAGGTSQGFTGATGATGSVIIKY